MKSNKNKLSFYDKSQYDRTDLHSDLLSVTKLNTTCIFNNNQEWRYGPTAYKTRQRTK